jgi:phospholipid/cholesterol/gamma-HCH transport system substrate-binding protein
MARVHELVDVLDAQNARLNTLIDHAEPVADALSTQRGADLDNLVDSTTDTLGVLADRQHDLRGTLAQLPSTLSSARTTLGTVSAAAEPTTNVLRSVRPVTDALPRISDELRGFSSSADPALTALTPVLDRAKHLLDEARPVVDQLRQAGPPLAGTARSATSLTEQVLRPHFGDLMEFLKGWAMSTTDYDAISHYFTAMVPESPRAVGQQLTGPIPGAPHAPVQGVPLPAPPAPRYDRLGSMLAPGHSSTGLSEHQEHSMLDQLLGGS